jgi:hypothetical protein
MIVYTMDWKISERKLGSVLRHCPRIFLEEIRKITKKLSG